MSIQVSVPPPRRKRNSFGAWIRGPIALTQTESTCLTTGRYFRSSPHAERVVRAARATWAKLIIPLRPPADGHVVSRERVSHPLALCHQLPHNERVIKTGERNDSFRNASLACDSNRRESDRLSSMALFQFEPDKQTTHTGAR